jgi:hypothetical protein
MRVLSSICEPSYSGSATFTFPGATIS